MLEKLFSSKARVEILKLFLFNPNNSFYQRQISQLSHQSIMGIQREVKKLESIGLIEKYDQGNRIYYKANRKCPIFEELKKIVFKSSGIAEVLKEYIVKQGKIKAAFIYGSYAKGEEALTSDLDLMVIGDVTLKKLSGILAKPKRELGREINYTVFSVPEFIDRLKNGDHFLNAILKEKKIFIIGDEDGLKKIIKRRQVNTS